MKKSFATKQILLTLLISLSGITAVATQEQKKGNPEEEIKKFEKAFNQGVKKKSKEEMQAILKNKTPEEILELRKNHTVELLMEKIIEFVISEQLKKEIRQNTFEDCLRQYPNKKEKCQELADTEQLLFVTTKEELYALIASCPELKQLFEEMKKNISAQAQ